MLKKNAQAYKDNTVLKKLNKNDNFSTQLVDDIHTLFEDGKMATPQFFKSKWSAGPTNTYSILDTPILKRHHMQQFIRKV